MKRGVGFKDTFRTIKGRLTGLDDQPIGKAGLIIILFLDLFVLIAVFNGLDQHTRQFSSPATYVPQLCRDIVIDRQWNASNRIDNLAEIVARSSAGYYRVEEKKKECHPVCTPYIDLLEQMKKDRALTRAFETLRADQHEAKELQRSIESLQGPYNTSLLETMAKEKGEKTGVDAIKKGLKEKTEALNTLKRRIASTEEKIDGDGRVRLLREKLEASREQDRARLLADLRRLNFWYPLKRLALQMIFLLPLFGAFYAWNSASIRRSRPVQVLVSSHLLIVSAIPVLWIVLETVYNVIPKIILKKVIELLESLRLVAIWHYLVIVIAIAAALLMIYVFQKKLFSPDKMMERRISKGACQHCGKRLPHASPSCPFCGFVQFRSCSRCNGPMHVHARYCKECGAPSEDLPH